MLCGLRVHAGLGLLPSIAGAMIAAAVFGVLTEWWVYAAARPGAPPLVALISSLGVYIALVNAVALAFGNETITLGGQAASWSRIGPVLLTPIQIVQLVTSTVVLVVMAVWLASTRVGRHIRAVGTSRRWPSSWGSIPGG